nr:hypothetical protein [Helicobacter suis]
MLKSSIIFFSVFDATLHMLNYTATDTPTNFRQRISNIRLDFLHKLTSLLVSHFDLFWRA